MKISDDLRKHLLDRVGAKDLSLNVYCINDECPKYRTCACTVSNAQKGEYCVAAIFPTSKEQAKKFGVDREDMYCGELGNYKYYIKQEE